MVPGVEVELLDPPSTVLSLVEPRTQPSVESPRQWPLVLELARMATLDNWDGSLGSWFQLDALEQCFV